MKPPEDSRSLEGDSNQGRGGGARRVITRTTTVVTTTWTIHWEQDVPGETAAPPAGPEEPENAAPGDGSQPSDP